VQDGTYRRSLRLRHGAAILALTPRRDHVDCELALEDPRDEAEGWTRRGGSCAWTWIRMRWPSTWAPIR
jgi:hypothetical protein